MYDHTCDATMSKKKSKCKPRMIDHRQSQRQPQHVSTSKCTKAVQENSALEVVHDHTYGHTSFYGQKKLHSQRRKHKLYQMP